MKKLVWLLVPLAIGIGLAGCGSTYPHRDPTGEVFPSVAGKALDGAPMRFPEDVAGAPALLLVGYDQDTQFDLDRWLLGLDQAGVRIRTYEVPTIPGLVPRMFKGTIDGGMRRGIPSEDWGAVVTVYKGGEKIARLTGNEDKLPGRILLLDSKGRIVFFHDRGYSVGTLRKLEAAIRKLTPGSP